MKSRVRCLKNYDIWGTHKHPKELARKSPRQVKLLSRDGRFGSKVGQIGPKWDKSRDFSDQISVHLAPTLEPKERQIGPKWDKSGAFSDQISVHLAPPRQMH